MNSSLYTVQYLLETKKIAFTSCSKIQKQPVQPAWQTINQANADHLLLLGDNVYSPNRRWNHNLLEARYKKQFDELNFKNLIANTPFNATWDDHDYGPNNARGAHVPDEYRIKSRELFHKYMDCSTNLPHVYHSFELGQIKVIMLDIRFYRQKSRIRGATLLGQEQEEWLERELAHYKEFTIVCSDSCFTKGGERLKKYKDYHRHLCSMLKQRGKTLVLSGDIHKNRFVEHDGRRRRDRRTYQIDKQH